MRRSFLNQSVLQVDRTSGSHRVIQRTTQGGESSLGLIAPTIDGQNVFYAAEGYGRPNVLSRANLATGKVQSAPAPLYVVGMSEDAGAAGATGAKGDTRATGPAGPSNAYVATSTTDGVVGNAANVTFVQTTLPAGEYILQGAGTVTRNADQSTVTCTLAANGTTVMTQDVSLDAQSLRTPLSLAGGAANTNPIVVTLICQRTQGTGSWSVRTGRITAIKVASVTNSAAATR